MGYDFSNIQGQTTPAEKEYDFSNVASAVTEFDFSNIPLMPTQDKLRTSVGVEGKMPIEHKAQEIYEDFSRGIKQWEEWSGKRKSVDFGLSPIYKEFWTAGGSLDILTENAAKAVLGVPLLPKHAAEKIYDDKFLGLLELFYEFTIKYPGSVFKDYVLYLHPGSTDAQKEEALTNITQDPLGIVFARLLGKGALKGIKATEGLARELPAIAKGTAKYTAEAKKHIFGERKGFRDVIERGKPAEVPIEFDVSELAEGRYGRVGEVTEIPPQKLYRGVRSKAQYTIDEQGNLILRAAENFEGKQAGVSMTPSAETALEYAARFEGGGSARSLAQAKIFEIDTRAIDKGRLFRESGEEISARGMANVVVPKGKWRVVKKPAIVKRQGELQKWETEQSKWAKKLSDKELINEHVDDVIVGERAEFARGLEEPMAKVSKGVSEDIVAKYGVNPRGDFVYTEIKNRINASDKPTQKLNEFVGIASKRKDAPYDVGAELRYGLEVTEMPKPEVAPKPKPAVAKPKEIPFAPLEDIRLLEEYLNLVEDFNKPRVTKKRKAEIIEQSKRIKKTLIKGGYNAEYLYLLSNKEIGLPIPKPSPTAKPADPTTRKAATLGFMGADPEAFMGLVNQVKTATKEIADFAESQKTKPEIGVGLEVAKKAFEQHDRMGRQAEFTAMQLMEIGNRLLPDKAGQESVLYAYQHKLKGKWWKKLTKEEKAATKLLKEEYAKLDAYAKKHKTTGIWEHEELNRTFQWWINPRSGKPYPWKYGKFSRTLPQGKKRHFASTEEGQAAGMIPASVNPFELLGKDWISHTQANSARVLIKTLYNIKGEQGVKIQLRKGKPLKDIRVIESYSKLSNQGLTEGYTRYSHPALDKALTFKDANGTLVRIKDAIGVKDEIYPHFRAYIENPTYSKFEQLNFAAKSLKLGLSAFHIFALGAQEAANWRVPFANIKRGLEIRKRFDDPALKTLYQEGLDLKKGYEDVGYRNSFFEGESWWANAGNTVTYPIKIGRDFIFNVVQPGMKISFAYDKYNKGLSQALTEGLTKEQWARKVVQMADGHFSGEHWKRSLLETNRFMVKAYFTPEARRVWQALLLSPTWQREHLLVAKNVAKSFMTDRMIAQMGLAKMAKVEKASYRKYAMGALTMIAAADLYNQMATHIMDGERKHIWENPEGKFFAVRALWNEPPYTIEDKNGNERVIKGGHAYFRPYKSTYEVAEWGHDPPKKFAYKISPLLMAIWRQILPGMYDTQYEGWGDMDDRLKDFLLDVGTPITAGQGIDVLKGKKTLASGAVPFFGMPTSKLKRELMEKLYYPRLKKLRDAGQWDAFYKLEKEFEKFGFKFSIHRMNKITQEER